MKNRTQHGGQVEETLRMLTQRRVGRMARTAFRGRLEESAQAKALPS